MNVVVDMSSRRQSAQSLPAPLVLGIGGTLRPHSTSEQALRIALQAAEQHGARTEIITAQELDLPMYDFGCGTLEKAARLIDAVRRADGLIVSTPAYHGGLSGLLKNALDYLQELAGDPSPYLHRKAVGCIVSAGGWQAGAATLVSIRSIVHALRGWPTPLGVTVNSANKPFSPDGDIQDIKIGEQLRILGGQVATFAQGRQLACATG
ncbi:NADPH-dependent FMN reductase [Pseudorhodoplanes sp.]|jgi:FMN reductase|uniref:NADPH-dependent FMN reductase n=1 Tax=Pseudorhodoplanes sp. TaxID=1934341 RepID=UPI002B71F524|nr:NADPH-dependent FMN reductase [Pseudorhodoplanes sp.]HWV39992.1 NADPH-dependent FMN reductase [Pseudorhodoplanes sp.]